ncbi:response regulator transcription factor [Nocardia brasiliensis]|uniref:winged helix-turn-helix domain-containing protein n=1 Tax=Nocardia brasiliensis TaxID=37326 RepID=UPI0004A75932|nr:response regulator transcription factor [Nocardia brasiliensis]MBF6125359.1 response regulator transcription factor [Nocardia brasiliensis]MBF6544969.1 response regulator transcription factor [Nocardia brasiliensis]
MRVLVVEDDEGLGIEVAAGLRAAGFAVDLAGRLADADLKISVNTYDVLVVDRGLPDGDGLRLVAHHRAAGLRVPVLMLTARDGLADRIAGFDHGADDYLVKPFALPELAARVRALSRRREHPAPARIVLGDIDIDLPRRRVQRAGILRSLTPKEFAVLELLATRAGTVVSRSELIECCWDEMAEPVSNVVDAVIAQLRRKLGPPQVIETVRGTGFMIGSAAFAR